MRVGAVDQQFRPAGQVGQHRLGQAAHRGDVFGDVVGFGLGAGRAQDQAQRRGRRPPCASAASASSASRVLFVADAARDVQAGRVGGDDGIAALEQQARR